MKRYSFDIDGTICQNTYGEYKKCVPYVDRIKKINQLFEEGNFIIYFTARGMGSCDGNANWLYKNITTIHGNNLNPGIVNFINYI